MKKITALFLGIFIPFLGFASHAQQVFVSLNGSDTNPGTREHPFATIQKAVDAGNNAVVLEKGTYFLTEPIRIKTSIDIHGDIGSSTQSPVVTISGGKKITGFQEVEQGLVAADIPEVKAGTWNFRDLYVNDHRAIRARSPNAGYFRIEKAGEDRRTNFIYKEGDLKKWKDLDNVELVFLHDWSITRCPIKEINEAQRRLTVPHRLGCDLDFFKIDGWEPHPRYFVENSIEFLDAPGEWFLDTKEGKLLYRLKEGESADTLEVIAPVAAQLLVIEGTPEEKVSALISNIRFAHAAYFPKPRNTVWEVQAAAFMTPGGEQGSSQRLQPSPAAVHFEYVNNIRVGNCLFEHLGENGLWFSKGCSDSAIQESIFRDIGANGIMIGTHDHENTVAGCTVQRSLVEKTGKTLFGSVGIWIGITQETNIVDSIVREVPYTGISCGWQWNPQPTPARANVIRNNLIYNCMQTLSDGGGIYTLGFQPDSLIEGNIIHGIPRAAGTAESNGMFLDEGTKGFTLTKNVVFGTDQSSLRFHQAKENVVSDNILLNKVGVPMIRYNSTPEANLELINNRNYEGSMFVIPSAFSLRNFSWH
jgi:hypothetical protein